MTNRRQCDYHVSSFGARQRCHPECTREGSGPAALGRILREYAQDDTRWVQVTVGNVGVHCFFCASLSASPGFSTFACGVASEKFGGTGTSTRPLAQFSAAITSPRKSGRCHTSSRWPIDV